MKFKFSALLLPAVYMLFAGVKPAVKVHRKRHQAALSSYADTTVTNFFKRSSGWIASDGALTIPLNNGRVLWLMGDSHINDYNIKTATTPCLFQVRNAALLQPYNNWQWQQTQTLTGKGPGNKNYFKFNADDHYFTWPGGGVQIADTVYVYCSSLQNTSGGGAFGFAPAGNDYWAKVKVPEMTVAAYTRLPSFAGISFGFSVIKNNADGYVYVYGSKLKVIQGEIYIARFPAGDPNASWTFWNGKSWVADVAKSAVIGYSPSSSVSFCKVKDKYIMISSQFSVDCDQGKNIYSAVADNPLGPFSKPKVVYTIPDRKQGHSPFFYSVFGHPEYINGQNELLVTYSINGYGKCVVDCVNGRSDPNIYRPRGVRVPLKLIDPSL